MQIRCKSRNAVTLIPVTILEVIGRGCLVRVSLSFSCNRGAAGARGTGSVCRADGFYDVGRTPRVARPLRSEADVRHLPETQISFGRAVYSRLRAYARVAPRDSSETRVFYIEEERGASPKPVKIPEPRERRFDASGLDYLGRSSFVFGPYRSSYGSRGAERRGGKQARRRARGAGSFMPRWKKNYLGRPVICATYVRVHRGSKVVTNPKEIPRGSERKATETGARPEETRPGWSGAKEDERKRG